MMFCFSCLAADAAELGFIVEKERRVLDGEEYRYIVNNNEGSETPCKTLTDVYVAIEEYNDLRKQQLRKQYAGAACQCCEVLSMR
jgi:hypothetical protein